MYRYEVDATTKSDIEGVIGRPVFYDDGGKYYIDDPNQVKSFQYYDSGTDTHISKTLDQICQDLYTLDFDPDKSTKTEYTRVEQVQLNTTTPGGTSLMAVKKADGTSFTAVTHDFTNKCSWYQGSKQKVDEVLTGSGTGPYSGSENDWIDVESGIIYQQHKYPEHIPVVKIDDVVQTSGYTVDYALGEVTFDTTTSGTVKCSYSYADSGDFILEPEAGKCIGLEHSEIQFTKDVNITTPVNFEVWVYNPLVDLGETIDPDDKTWYPGKPTPVGYNPLRFLYKFEKYNNIKDIINTANLGQGSIPAMPNAGIDTDVLVFPFNYVTEIKLASSTGAQMRVTLDSHTAFTGEWATGTFYCISETE